jgi:glycosyltransferase involved in cell wall biosynthesis
MKILAALTYYRPHYSGLTIYAERLARALVERGHQVTVLTSRFSDELQPHEMCEGVQVIRPKVAMRVSKGVLMPSIPLWAYRLAKQADIVNLHVPQLDAGPIALLSRLLGKPVVLTYHCDLQLPEGFIHALANRVSNLANHMSALAADCIITNTRDYAENSPFLRRYLDKVHPIFPPVSLEPATEADVQAFRRKAGIQPGQRIIGMAARLATEKGVEYLVQAMPQVLEKHPTARVLFVGQYEGVLGEERYAERLAPLIENLGDHWTFLGILSPKELTAFFTEADVTILPSINSTESFGMVQVEAMSCGTPVVATDLPGVRAPVQLTSMGRIVPPANADELARAILEILDSPQDYRREGHPAIERLSPASVAEEYERIFTQLLKKKRAGRVK